MKLMQSNWRPSKVVLLIMVLAPLALAAYLWISQFYYPSNYLSAMGSVTNVNDVTNNRQQTSFYTIKFNSNNGQSVTYQYEAPQNTLSLNQNILLHYNKNNPNQVRIKPSLFLLIREFLIVLALPVAILIIARAVSHKFSRYFG